MFNIEKEINNWKKSLRKNRSLEDGYIEELESHLRDLIEDKINKGISEKESFEISIKELGKINEIGNEYFKSDTTNKVSGKPSWQPPKWMPELVWNYFKVAVRNIKRQKGFSAINILGLSIGLASVILISLLVIYEVSFDQSFKNKDDIYRVCLQINREDVTHNTAISMFPLAPAVKDEVPGIKKVVRVSESFKLLTYEDKKFYNDVAYVDEDYFEIFSQKLKYGNPDEILKQPYSVVLDEETSEKYFGDENPIGKTLLMQNKENLTVTGVFEKFPSNSHIQNKVLISISSLYKTDFPRLEAWTSLSNDYTYILLDKKSDPSAVEENINSILNKNIEEELQQRYYLFLQPLSGIHFSNLSFDFAKTVPPTYLYIFASVAFFILIIACINFINLTTAKSAKRYKEVGIRKSTGASRVQLIKQFLSESFVITFLSFCISLVVVILLIPEVNTLLKADISISLLFNVETIIIIAALLMFTSLTAGAYPAFVLSSAKPALVLKNMISKSTKGYHLRAVLVVVQFALSVFLIIGTITIYNQIDFLTTQDLGFKSDEIIVVPVYDEKVADNSEPLKNALLKNTNIANVTFSTGTPGSGSTSTSNFVPEGRSQEEEVHLQRINVDYDFFDTYGVKLISGRNFAPEFGGDKEGSYIINESAAKKIGFENPIGKTLSLGGEEEPKTIIGVVKDFHYDSMKETVNPTVFMLDFEGSRFASIKFNPVGVSKTVEFIKKTIEQISPTYPVEYYFLNEKFERFYRAERTIGKLLAVFTVLAILISCIGILGLVSFIAEQKSKEIGIRKVLGASVSSILILISKQFLKWVVFSNIIIWPAAYYFLESWLSKFPYRIEISYIVFISTLVFSLLITLATVGFHAAKAALSNPVKSLRYE